MASQGLEQLTQTVMVNLVHEVEQAANFPFGETFTRKPVQVIAGKICQHRALVFAKRHAQRDQLLQIFWVHRVGLIQRIQQVLRVLNDGLRQLQQQMAIDGLLRPTVRSLEHWVSVQVVGHFEVGGLLLE